MTLVSQSTTNQTPPTVPPAPPSVNARDGAPRVSAYRGDVVRLRTAAYPRVEYRVKVMRHSGPYHFIGTVTAGANGSVTLPAIQMDRSGNYTLALEDGGGTTYYISVVVA